MTQQLEALADALHGTIIADTDSGARYRLDVADDVALVPKSDELDVVDVTSLDLLEALDGGHIHVPNADGGAVRGAIARLDGGEDA